jgi:acyl-CoA reductase-like NAD-dependent aldehyde dehydrogenase
MQSIERLISTNPGEGFRPIGEVEVTPPAEIQAKMDAAHAAEQEWRDLGVEGRTQALTPISQEFTERADELAALITEETGKPIEQALAEAKGYTDQIYLFYDQAKEGLEDTATSLDDDPNDDRIVFEPKGATAVITPWNFPYGMAVWGVVPNLLAGNPVVLKTSEENPLVGKFIEEVFNRHNLPEGVFSEVYGGAEQGEQLVKSGPNFIWFTGSTATGRRINSLAAETFTPTLLEMGGSNPAVVFEDADIETALLAVFNSRFQHNGQVCDSVKRLIVHESLKPELQNHLIDTIGRQKIGLPRDPETFFGSLVAGRQVELLNGQVSQSLANGARVYTPQLDLSGLDGAYFPPVVMDGINPLTDRVWREETFGPVLPIVSFRTEQEAIALANDTVYGLGALVVSEDLERAERVASRIKSGVVDINSASHWENAWNPFGGVKMSGNGREHGMEGMRHLTDLKTISSPR